MKNITVAIILMSLVSLTVQQASVTVLSTSTIDQCETGNGLNCTGVETANNVELLVTPPNSGGSTQQVLGELSFDISVVPNLQDAVSPGDAFKDRGAGSMASTSYNNLIGNVNQTLLTKQCNSATTEQCQPTIPATVLIEADQPVYIYEFDQLSSRSDIPYQRMYVSSNSFSNCINQAGERTTCNEDSLLVDGSVPVGECTCNYDAFTYNKATTQKSFTQSDINTLFFDPVKNKQYFSCPLNDDSNYNPDPPYAEYPYYAYEGSFSYKFSCNCDGSQVIDYRSFELTYTGMFTEMQPYCTIHHINPIPTIAVDFDIVIQTPLRQEVIELSSLDIGNRRSSSGRSEPFGGFTAEILGILDNDMFTFPYIEGWWVSCDAAAQQENVVMNMVDDDDDTSGDTSDPDDDDDGDTKSLSYNPYDTLRQGYKLPIEEFIDQVYDDDDDDSFASTSNFPSTYRLEYFIPIEMAPVMTSECGGEKIPSDLFTNPPDVMRLQSHQNSEDINVDLSTLVLATNGGTNDIGQLLTCVPGHSTLINDITPPNPCFAQSTYRRLLKNAADLDNRIQQILNSDDDGDEGNLTIIQQLIQEIASVRTLLLPGIVRPDNLNAWTRYNRLFIADTQIQVSYDILITTSANFVSYNEPITNGDLSIDNPENNCVVQLYPTSPESSGLLFYQVCNYDDLGNPGDYTVVASCGKFSEFDSTTNTFTNPSFRVTPSERDVGNILANRCYSSFQEKTPFNLIYIGDGNYYQNSQDYSADPVICYAELRANSNNPAEIVLGQPWRKGCLLVDNDSTIDSFDDYADYVYDDDDIEGPQNDDLAIFTTPTPSTTPSASVAPIESDGDSTSILISVIVILLGVLIIAMIVCLLALCCINSGETQIRIRDN